MSKLAITIFVIYGLILLSFAFPGLVSLYQIIYTGHSTVSTQAIMTSGSASVMWLCLAPGLAIVGDL